MQHDIVYGVFKYLPKRRASDKLLRDNAFNTAKNPKYDGYQKGLAFIVYKFFHKKSKDSGFKSAIKYENKQNEQLAEELH